MDREKICYNDSTKMTAGGTWWTGIGVVKVTEVIVTVKQ